MKVSPSLIMFYFGRTDLKVEEISSKPSTGS